MSAPGLGPRFSAAGVFGFMALALLAMGSSMARPFPARVRYACTSLAFNLVGSLAATVGPLPG